MSKLKMPDLNIVIIAGNLTSDPLYSSTSNGISVCNIKNIVIVGRIK